MSDTDEVLSAGFKMEIKPSKPPPLFNDRAMFFMSGGAWILSGICAAICHIKPKLSFIILLIISIISLLVFIFTILNKNGNNDNNIPHNVDNKPDTTKAR